MKTTGLRVAAFLALFAISTPLFAEITVETDAGPIVPPADPVAELRNHDDAFALLIECFRQLQTGLIEADYNARLAAADKLSDDAKAQDVRELSRQERDLRFEKLDAQLARMTSAYGYSRQGDEREAGVVVPMQVNTTVAAKKLEDFVAIVPVTKKSEKDEIVVTRIIPANLILHPNRSSEVIQAANH